MKIKATGLILFNIVVFIFIFLSCKNGAKTDDSLLDDSDNQDEIIDTGRMLKVKKIFINIPSPIEMATIMQRAGATYESDLLNPVKNIDKYTTIAQSALNLGTYGADLSYTRMFDQIQESVNYLAVIRKLSDRLGIPQDEGSFAVGRIEENIDNRDSLLLIISETYATADTYLKENDRGSTAALIIFGGWIEALYISTHIIDEKNPNQEIMQRIGEQKLSLENLVELMDVYKNDEAIMPYMPMLTELKSVFEGIKISYSEGKITTDTTKKLTTIGGETNVSITINNIKEIINVVDKIRAQIIN
ncbi:MAG: hypothetical protein HY738_03780 [Bacteroidia bacterium]|nr:hypothetical protein [Bacteroidia bacterium]